jgi:hypothetical protein
MKTTISTLLIPLIGALIVTLASCSGIPTGPGTADPSPGCTIGDSGIVRGHGTHCPL